MIQEISMPDNLSLELGKLGYKSETNDAELENLNLNLVGDFVENVADIANLNLDVKQLSLQSGGVQYLNKAHVQTDMKGTADLANSAFDLDGCKIEHQYPGVIGKRQSK